MLSRVKVNCPSCDGQNDLVFNSLKKLELQTCTSCGHRFNLYGLYQSLYDTIPLCAQIVNVYEDSLTKKYSIKGGSQNEKSKLEYLLAEIDFPKMLRSIYHDTLLFGSSFWCFDDDQFTRLIPELHDFKVDWVQTPPFKSLSEKIIEIENRETGKKFDQMSFIHLLNRGIDELGESICRFWFTSWYNVKNIGEWVFGLKSIERDTDTLEKIQGFTESGIISAAGIPYHRVFPWAVVSEDYKKDSERHFSIQHRMRKESLSRQIESRIFPKLLGRDYDYDTFPKLEFID
ncbi:MAG: hypothetical protein ACTSQY_09725 [Candidatus Odinarchaeia archaeon]